MSFTPQTSIVDRVTRIQGRLDDFALPLTDTKIVEGATPIEAGMAVIKGASAEQVILPVATFTFAAFRGIAVWSPVDKEKNLDTGVKVYELEDTLAIAKEGQVEVLVTDTVVEGGSVWFVHTTGGASDLHTFRSDIDTDKAAKIPAVYDEDGTTGDVVKIRVSLGARIGTLT